mgnify:FL=1
MNLLEQMEGYDSIGTGKHNAKIVDVEVSRDVRFGRHVADVYKPIYALDEWEVKDNGIFRYKKADGYLFDNRKNWGYAKFLRIMDIEESNDSSASFQPNEIIGKLVVIEIYEKTFTNEFSKRVKYPVGKLVKLLELPF